MATRGLRLEARVAQHDQQEVEADRDDEGNAEEKRQRVLERRVAARHEVDRAAVPGLELEPVREQRVDGRSRPRTGATRCSPRGTARGSRPARSRPVRPPCPTSRRRHPSVSGRMRPPETTTSALCTVVVAALDAPDEVHARRRETRRAPAPRRSGNSPPRWARSRLRTAIALPSSPAPCRRTAGSLDAALAAHLQLRAGDRARRQRRPATDRSDGRGRSPRT